MPRQRDYLFRRRNSPTWYCRLQYRGRAAEIMGRQIEDICLKTSDRAQAELLALEHVKEHKLFLMVVRNAEEGAFDRAERGDFLFEPGREHIRGDGNRVIATPTKLIIIDPEGKIIEERENGRAVMVRFKDPEGVLKDSPRPPACKTSHDKIIETWIAAKAISPYLQKEARDTFALFKGLTGGKPLKDCEWEDGLKLAQTLLERGNKRATVAKKISHLNAAVNLAIQHKKLGHNPFTRCVPKLDDALEVLFLSDEDMDLVREHFHKLDAEHQRLFVLLATTGMRRGEPFQIVEEFKEAGIRYIMTGSKTDQSRRKIPLPNAALPYLPAKITGPLFSDTPKNMGRNLIRFLRRIGITDERKRLHSLRHRAKDRLRAVSCPLDVQYELLGHEEKTVAASYGRGSPMTVLKHWVERMEGW